MYKLNLTEIELRKQAVDETKDHIVHAKNGLVIDNDTKNDKRKSKSDYSGNKEENEKPKRFITVNAIKRRKINISAKKNSSYESQNVSGTFIDRLK